MSPTENYLEVVEDAIIVIAGNSITEGAKDSKSELGKMLYQQVRLYVDAERFNVDLADGINKRQNFFQPHFMMTALDKESTDKLKDKFKNINPSQAQCESIWTRFKDCQSYVRNEALPMYMKDYIKKISRELWWTMNALWRFGKWL